MKRFWQYLRAKLVMWQCHHDYYQGGMFLNTDIAIVQCRLCGKSRKMRPVCPVLAVHAMQSRCQHDWREGKNGLVLHPLTPTVTYTCTKCGKTREEKRPMPKRV